MIGVSMVLICICTKVSEKYPMIGAGERAWSEKCPSDHLVGLGLILSSHLTPGFTAPVTPALGTERQEDPRTSLASLA